MGLKQDFAIQCDRSSSPSSEKSVLTRRKKLQPCQLPVTPNSYKAEGQMFPDKCDDSQSTSSSSSTNLHRRLTNLPCQSLTKDCPRYLKSYESYSVFRKPLRRSLSLPDGFRDSTKLRHPHLTEGDREYLRYKAAVYSMGDMKGRVEWRFRQAIQHQIDTGFHTREECQKYFDYLDKPRKKQFGGDKTAVWRRPPQITPRPLHFHQRSATAPPGFSSKTTAEIRTGSALPTRPKSSYTQRSKDSAVYYDSTTKRTLHGQKQPEPKV